MIVVGVLLILGGVTGGGTQECVSADPPGTESTPTSSCESRAAGYAGMLWTSLLGVPLVALGAAAFLPFDRI